MKDCIIVGGGAAGMVAAIEAKRAGAKSVLLVEKQSCLGKKLSQTGNGRANFTNLSMPISAYRSNHPECIPPFLAQFNSKDSLEYFKSLGIYPKFRGDYVYPYSDQAKSLVQCLENALHKLGVEICLQHRVEAISWTEKEGFFLKGKKLLPKRGDDSSFHKDHFSDYTLVSGSKEKNRKKEKNKKEKMEWEEKEFSLQGRKLLIASGGLAMEALGASGEGYGFAKTLSHTVSPLFPSLVPIYTKEDYVKLWSGVRVDVRAKLWKEQDLLFQDEGELQCTDYGISGIIVFQMSRLVHTLLQDKAKFFKQNIPYLAFFYVGNIFSHHVRAYTGGDVIDKIFQGILELNTMSFIPSIHPTDILMGVGVAALIKFVVYTKGKNAKKFRQGKEYGSARWVA